MCADLRIGAQRAILTAKEDAGILRRRITKEQRATRRNAGCFRNERPRPIELRPIEPTADDRDRRAEPGKKRRPEGQELGELSATDVVITLPRDREVL